MSSVQERLQLKRVPLDTWNTREQLCLASAVVRSGDQNWMSVSRALKTVGEPNRPPDWYSQKSCAAQYGALLEHVETPKRKKRCSEGAVETPQESILKRLTQERIVEIQKTVAEMHQQYEQLKNEITEVRNPATSEDRLRELWSAVEAAKRARERESARRAAWLKEREERRARADRTWRPPQPTTPTSQAPAGAPTPPTPAPPSSPLLTSLLKSSPVVTTPQHISHPANSIETVSPSATAPTLSMLLEKPAPAAAANSSTSTTSTSSQQESKNAAIEHIKSQLVQIEQQLIASTCASPVPLAPAPAVDIDDIEIKAEDVYAFRDIDIHIPPVTAMHKPTARVLDKPTFKKEEVELVTPMETDEPVNVEVVKEEPTPAEAIIEEVIPTPIEQAIAAPPAAPEPEVKISFPDAFVKFPTTEIKVINPQEVKIKDEVKEPEVPAPEPEREAEEEAQEEEPHVEVVEESAPPPPAVTPPDPGRIPLPPEPEGEAPAVESIPDIPMPPEPEAPLTEESQEETEEVEVELEAEEQAAEELVVEDIKKEIVHDEDSMPLKDIMKEEALTGGADGGGAGGPQGGPGGPGGVKLELEDAHTETDDDTPMELSREEEKDGKKKRDYSRKKKSESRTYSGSESAPDSPSASDAERQHRLWKKSVMLVYSRLCAHKYASLFVRPISDEEAPGYSMVIKRPMDLTAIRRNIDNGNIRTTAEFQRDVLLMLSNALMYNSSEHSVYTMTKEMHEEAAGQLGMLLAAQAHAGLGPAPPPRRKRRREPPLPALQHLQHHQTH